MARPPLTSPPAAPFFVDPAGCFHLGEASPSPSAAAPGMGEMVAADVDRFQRIIRRHQIRVPQRLSHRKETGQLLVEMRQGAYAVARMPDRDETEQKSNQYGRLIVIFSRDPADLEPVHLTSAAYQRLFPHRPFAPQAINLCKLDPRAANQIEVVANFETPNGEENLLNIDELLSAVYAHHKTFLDRNLDFHYLYRTGTQIFENDAVRFAIRSHTIGEEEGAPLSYDIRIILGDGYGSKLPDIDHERNIGALIVHISERALSGVADRDQVIRPLFKCYSEAMRYGLAPSDIALLTNRPDLVQTVEDLHVRSKGLVERVLQVVRYPLVRFFSKVLAQMSRKDQQTTGALQLVIPVLSALSIATIQFLLRGMLAAAIAIIVSLFNNIFRLFRHTTKRVVVRSENIDLLNQPGRFIHPLMTQNFDEGTQGPIDPQVLQNLVYVDARNPEEEISAEVSASAHDEIGVLSGAADILDPASASNGSIYSLLRFYDQAGRLSANEVLHIEQPAPRYGFDAFHILHELPGREDCQRRAYVRLRPDLADKRATPMEKAVRQVFDAYGEAPSRLQHFRITEDANGKDRIENLSAADFMQGLRADATLALLSVDRPQIREQMSELEAWARTQEERYAIEANQQSLWSRFCRRFGLFKGRAERQAARLAVTKDKLAAIRQRQPFASPPATVEEGAETGLRLGVAPVELPVTSPEQPLAGQTN